MKNRSKVVLSLLMCVMIFSMLTGVSLSKEKTFLIGVPEPMGFDPGHQIVSGMNLAVEEINAKGGVLGRPIVLKVVDTRDREAGVPVADCLASIEKLILKEKVDVLCGGPDRSEVALATFELVAKHKIPHLFASVGPMSPKLAQVIATDPEKYKYTFKVVSHAGHLVKTVLGGVMQMKKDFGFDSFFQLGQDVIWARGAAGIAAKMLKKAGFKDKGAEYFPLGCTDFAPGLMKARISGAPILLYWMDMPQTVAMLKLWHDMKIKGILIGASGGALASHKTWDMSGGKIKYLMDAECPIGQCPAKVNEWHDRFRANYKKKYGHWGATMGPAYGYMGIYIMVDAVKRAGGFDKAAIAAAIQETDMIGVFGRVTFDKKTHHSPYGNDPEKEAVMGVIQWMSATPHLVYPPKLAASPITLPEWMVKK
ncbi:MAG: ABC transporter substrate-binding protein [Thermodesulfobacteriota bacterium]|nr:ABC transporter substrate-binding protein [Thermodesulfobacteriota bacterium]